MINPTPLIHNQLLEENKVKPINENDKQCLQEIKDVLKKYNNLDRFGVTLLHKHFDIEDDEILIEATNEETRTQVIKPFKKQEVEKMKGEIIETSWSLIDGQEVLTACRRRCVRQDGGHYNSHVFSS